MENSNLLTPLSNFQMDSSSNIFIDFIGVLEGWKTKSKNLHWAAPKKNVHKYLDKFYYELIDFQDAIAEGHMGILGQMAPNAVNTVKSEVLNANDLIVEVRSKTLEFYNKIPEESIYKGLKAETETFIQSINKYKYLFSLCDVRPY